MSNTNFNQLEKRPPDPLAMPKSSETVKVTRLGRYSTYPTPVDPQSKFSTWILAQKARCRSARAAVINVVAQPSHNPSLPKQQQSSSANPSNINRLVLLSADDIEHQLDGDLRQPAVPSRQETLETSTSALAVAGSVDRSRVKCKAVDTLPCGNPNNNSGKHDEWAIIGLPTNEKAVEEHANPC